MSQNQKLSRTSGESLSNDRLASVVTDWGLGMLSLGSGVGADLRGRGRERVQIAKSRRADGIIRIKVFEFLELVHLF